MLFALLLSRVRVPDRRLGSLLLAYVSLMFAYGFMIGAMSSVPTRTRLSFPRRTASTVRPFEA